MASYYVVQSYSTYKGAVRADAPVQANSINQARKMAERLAKHKAAVVAFMREGNLKSGDFEDPKLIAAYGENLPEEVLEMERI